MIRVSVVVATFRRCEVLKVTLEKLAAQTFPGDQFEVVVVDDGSGDGTQPMVEGMMASVPYALRYLVHANQGPGYSENRGIRAAQGEIVVLMADDIHPTPAMLTHHAAFHDARPEPHVAGLGRVLQSPELPKSVFQTNWDPFKYWELNGQVELPYWKFWACNISVKRQFLLDHGLFQEWKGAAHEDVELGYRLSRHGLRIYYNPDALAHHYHVETLEGAARRAYERGRNWAFIHEYIPDPQLVVKYHILTRYTIGDHIHTFRNLERTSLPREDRNLPWLLFRQTVRWLVFNRWTVPGFWMRLLPKAETNAVIAAIVNPYAYRGAVFYYFVKGCVESQSVRKMASSAKGA